MTWKVVDRWKGIVCDASLSAAKDRKFGDGL